jgi:hypothetical protein
MWGRCVVAVVLVGCSNTGSDAVTTTSADTVVPVIPAAAPVASPTRPTPPPTDESTSTLVKFEGDDLVTCASVDMTVRRPQTGANTSMGIGPVLASELLMSGHGGHSMMRDGGLEYTSVLLSFLSLDHTWDPCASHLDLCHDARTKQMVANMKKDRGKFDDGILKSMNSTLDKIRSAKDGSSLVTSCPANRIALGTCRLSAQFDDLPIAWTAEVRHYDVASTSDSDSAMKDCLRLHGDWTAPARDDSDAAMERAHQHMGSLRRALQ